MFRMWGAIFEKFAKFGRPNHVILFFRLWDKKQGRQPVEHVALFSPILRWSRPQSGMVASAILNLMIIGLLWRISRMGVVWGYSAWPQNTVVCEKGDNGKLLH